MQVGCGVYVHPVRERRYLYFWHYESRGGSRVQVKDYVGPVDSARARGEAAHRCEASYAKVADDLEKLRTSSLAEIRTPGTTCSAELWSIDYNIDGPGSERPVHSASL